MTSHLHTQIRDALKTALTGLVKTGDNVFTGRLSAIQDKHLPALRIYIDSETADPITLHQPQSVQRQPLLIVEACTKKSDAIEDELDQIGLEVEVALSSGISVDGHTIELTYGGMEFDFEMLEKPVGIKRHRFYFTYAAMSNAPDTII